MSEEIPSLRTRLDQLENLMKEVRGKLDDLIVSEAQRRGREARDERGHTERYGDRWQVWVRSLIPTTILTLLINGLIAFFTLEP